MSINLKRKVYSKLLSEMAIITQTSFLERVMLLAENKPKIIGGGISSYSDLLIKIEDSRLEDKEKSLFIEIAKCIKHTGLLDLAGKENKKARKKAEVLIIKQLRRYTNIDGQNIEFKGILPMFDNILDFLENKPEANFDDCILAADLYMRRFFDIANEEDKKEISKGKFDFSIIFQKTNFYQQFLKSDISVSESSTIQLYEDENLKIVYPTTPSAFNSFIGSMDIDLSWCTQNTSSWYNYSDDHYICIAVQKKLKKSNDEYCFSLKVDFEGIIDPYATVDRYNIGCEQPQIDSIFMKAKSAVSELPDLVENNSGQDMDFDNIIKGLADLNSVDELKEVFAKICNVFAEEEAFQKYEYLIDNTSLDKLKAADVIVDSLSFYFFDNPMAAIYNFLDITRVKKFPIEEIFANLKQKVLENGAHPRYFYAFLKLSNNDIKTLISFKEINKSISIALDTTNTNNFNKIIQELLSNKNASYLLNPESIKNKSAGLTKNNLDLYETIYNSKGFQALLKEQKVNILSSAGNNSFYESKYFISQLALRFTDSLTESLNDEGIDIESIDNHLIKSYLKQDFTSVFRFERSAQKGPEDRQFIEVSYDQYLKIRDNIFIDKQVFDKVLSVSDKDLRTILVQFISTSLSTRPSQAANPLNIGIDENTIYCLDKFFAYKDLNSQFLFSILFNQLPFDAEDFSNETKINISNIIFESRRLNSDIMFFVLRLLSSDKLSKECKNFFVFLSYRHSYKKISFIYDLWQTLIGGLGRGSYFGFSELPDVLDNILEFSFPGQEKNQFILNVISGDKENLEEWHILALCNTLAKTKNVNINIKLLLFMRVIKCNIDASTANEIPQNVLNSIGSYDSEVLCNDKVISFIKTHCKNPQKGNVTSMDQNNLTMFYGKNRFYTELLNQILYSCTRSNVVFPKNALVQMLLKRSSDAKTQLFSRTIVELLFKNFILINDGGQNFLRDEELSLVRNTLRELFGDNKYFFNNNETRKLVPKLIMKLNPVARKHMGIVFPEMSEEFFGMTDEERAELQADSLIRHYVKMLLS